MYDSGHTRINMNKLDLIHGVTPIMKLEKLSRRLGKNIYIKRDDLTGMEMSGNKIRKLEYSLAEAMAQKAEMVITCGALQSNHARATVAACKRLGLGVHLVLRGDEPEKKEGNLLLDTIFGAEISYLPAEAFADHENYMEALKRTYAKKGLHAYIIPIGASNGVGNLGYLDAYNEIEKQSHHMNIHFDRIVCAVGSGGTYSGLYLGSQLSQSMIPITGYSVGGTSEHFKSKCKAIISETVDDYLHDTTAIDNAFIDIVDKHQGAGYAITNTEQIAFIKEVAAIEGIIFDPVYTGKALFGLCKDIENGKYQQDQSVLFIHTGGIFGLGPFESWFHESISPINR